MVRQYEPNNPNYTISVYEADGNFYRHQVNNGEGIITEFSPISCDYIEVNDGGFYEVGGKALYVFIYKGTILKGNIEELRPMLKKILEEESVSLSCKFGICCFLNEGIEESIDAIIKANPGLGLTRNNFYIPKK